MTKIDVLDDVIEMLIRKAMDMEAKNYDTGGNDLNLYLKGEKDDGIPATTGKGESTHGIQ